MSEIQNCCHLLCSVAACCYTPEGSSAIPACPRKWLWFAGSWMDQLLWQLRQHDVSGILPADQKDPRVVDRTKGKWIKDHDVTEDREPWRVENMYT